MTSKSGQSSYNPPNISSSPSNIWTYEDTITVDSKVISPHVNPNGVAAGNITISNPPGASPCKGILETGPHAFTEDMEVWVVQGKKFTHYTFSHICPDMELPATPNHDGVVTFRPYAGPGIKPAITQVGDRNVCIECGEEFPEYKKLVTMWKMKSIGDSRSGIQSEE
jgi:hypothetical protein